jgi:hypothetical protein
MSRSYRGQVMRTLCFGLLMAVVITLQLSAESDRASVAAGLFIGQVYPSGNVYLKPLAGGERPAGNLPKSVLLLPLSSDSAVLRTPPTAATLASPTVKFDYIPRLEGMDNQHLTCGPTEPRKKNPAFRYLTEDFFDATVDYCDGNDDVALYRSSSLSYSVKVLAFTSETDLIDTRLVSGARPVTPAEELEIGRQRSNLQKEGECATTPAFVDSAERLVEAATGRGLILRLSSYKTPGCAGHLTTIYILDVLRGQEVVQTFQISQSHGPL